jgi:hypothetical protein
MENPGLGASGINPICLPMNADARIRVLTFSASVIAGRILKEASVVWSSLVHVRVVTPLMVLIFRGIGLSSFGEGARAENARHLLLFTDDQDAP